MITASYYPGCSLESTARDYAESISAVTAALGIELKELDDWNCCGASAAHSLDHHLALNLAARNLILAQSAAQPLVVPCALCFNRLKTAQAELIKDASGLTPELARAGADFGGVQVVELNRYLTSPEIVEACAAKAAHSLKGLRPVCYYGCQGQRPPAVTGRDDYEHPLDLEHLLKSLGAEVVDWAYQTDCCGASFAVSQPEVVLELSGRLYEQARQAGANCLVTGCQMCQANLDMNHRQLADRSGGPILPVFYFTELMGLALGHGQARRWLGRHMAPAGTVLAATDLPPELWE